MLLVSEFKLCVLLNAIVRKVITMFVTRTENGRRYEISDFVVGRTGQPRFFPEPDRFLGRRDLPIVRSSLVVLTSGEDICHLLICKRSSKKVA